MRAYVDRGYLGVQKMYEEVEVLSLISRKPGKEFSDAEKGFNRLTPESESTWNMRSIGSRLGG